MTDHDSTIARDVDALEREILAARLAAPAEIELEHDRLCAYYIGRRGPHASAQRRRLGVAWRLLARCAWYAAALDLAAIRRRAGFAPLRTTWDHHGEIRA